MRRSHRLAVVALVLVANCHGAAADIVKVGGAGAATELIRTLGAKFATSEDKVEIVPSLGSTGGLRAVQAGMLDIAVAGRQLNNEEITRGLVDRLAIRTPWGFATSRSEPNGLASTSIADIYLSQESRWVDGMPIRITLRPKGDSENQMMIEYLPGMTAALDQVRMRGGIPIAATDQDNADWAERVAGSLVSITYTQLLMEKRKLRMIAIDGVEPTFENFESGRYRFGKTLSLVTGAKPSAAALRFIAFLASPQGQAALRETGNLPVPK
jgi:phosphate transport system substrate-binding protein